MSLSDGVPGLLRATYAAIEPVHPASTVLADLTATAEDSSGTIFGTSFLSKTHA